MSVHYRFGNIETEGGPPRQNILAETIKYIYESVVHGLQKFPFWQDPDELEYAEPPSAFQWIPTCITAISPGTEIPAQNSLYPFKFDQKLCQA